MDALLVELYSIESEGTFDSRLILVDPACEGFECDDFVCYGFPRERVERISVLNLIELPNSASPGNRSFIAGFDNGLNA